MSHSDREGRDFLGRLLGRSRHDARQAGTQSEPAQLNLDDIQGFILRGYRMPLVRHFLLTVENPSTARTLLGRLVSGDESDAPQITTARDWNVGFEPGPGDNPADLPRRKPDYCLNVGITWPGMIALGLKDRLPTLSFKSFGAFVGGAADRAALVGDIGPSAPERWVGGFGTGVDHALITLHAINSDALTAYSERLTALFAGDDAFREIWRQDGAALTDMVDGKPVPTSKVHFGYTDGISQTTIRGGPERYPPDRHQKACEPWLFVLSADAENYFVPEPHELGLNGSFAVFKMAETDVVGFEDFLQSNRDKIDPELLAAKMCGRWRNGVPLMLSPDTDSPAGGITPEQLNDYDYVNADGSGDPRGVRCPIGAPPDQPARTAGCGARSSGRQQQHPSVDSPRDAVWTGLRSRPAV
jgi:hypothetical protein